MTASVDPPCTDPREPPLLAARLRRLIVVVAVLGIATAAIGLLPGEQFYSCHVSFTFGTEGGSTYIAGTACR